MTLMISDIAGRTYLPAELVIMNLNNSRLSILVRVYAQDCKCECATFEKYKCAMWKLCALYACYCAQRITIE